MHLHKQCLATSSTLSCAYWPFTNFLWRNVYSSPLPILQSGSLFFCCSVFSSLNIWIIIIYQIHNLQAFSPTLWFAFLFCEQCLWIHRCSKFSCSPISLFFSVICAFGVTHLPFPETENLTREGHYTRLDSPDQLQGNACNNWVACVSGPKS